MASSKISETGGSSSLHRTEQEYVDHEDKLKQLYEELKGKVYNYALRITKDPRIAEEVVSDVFLKLVGKQGSEAEINNFASYVMRMAHNAAVDKVTGEDGRKIESLDDHQNIAVTAQAITERIEREEILQIAMTDAKPEERLIFDLLREGMTRKEIAEHLKIDEAAAIVKVNRLLGRLRYRIPRQ